MYPWGNISVCMYGRAYIDMCGGVGCLCMCVYFCVLALYNCQGQLSSHPVLGPEHTFLDIEEVLNEASSPPFPLSLEDWSWYSGTKLWILDPHLQTWLTQALPTRLLDPHGLEPGSPHCPGMPSSPELWK